MQIVGSHISFMGDGSPSLQKSLRYALSGALDLNIEAVGNASIQLEHSALASTFLLRSSPSRNKESLSTYWVFMNISSTHSPALNEEMLVENKEKFVSNFKDHFARDEDKIQLEFDMFLSSVSVSTVHNHTDGSIISSFLTHHRVLTSGVFIAMLVVLFVICSGKTNQYEEECSTKNVYIEIPSNNVSQMYEHCTSYMNHELNGSTTNDHDNVNCCEYEEKRENDEEDTVINFLHTTANSSFYDSSMEAINYYSLAQRHSSSPSPSPSSSSSSSWWS